MLLSDSWVKALWAFASRHGIIIVDRTHSYPQIERENDIFLMEAFQAQKYTPQ